MPEPRHLNNAPIREALIDLQITPSVSLDALKQIGDRLTSRTHSRGEMWHASVGINLGADGTNATTNAARSPIGYRYDFKDAPYVLQCRVNGFTFSRLAPYEDWATMKVFAQELWEIYREATKPHAVARIAVRYINNIALPLPIADFSEYLRVSPDLPPELPQMLSSFLQRYLIVDDTCEDCAAAVTQVLEEQSVVANKVPVILDIDAFRTFRAGLSPSSNEVWTALDKLHDFKNRIFFNYLTEKAIGMFE